MGSWRQSPAQGVSLPGLRLFCQPPLFICGRMIAAVVPLDTAAAALALCLYFLTEKATGRDGGGCWRQVQMECLGVCVQPDDMHFTLGGWGLTDSSRCMPARAAACGSYKIPRTPHNTLNRCKPTHWAGARAGAGQECVAGGGVPVVRHGGHPAVVHAGARVAVTA